MDKPKPTRTGGSVKWQDRVGRRIKLRDLHVVLAVAQTGSMAKAAGRLAMSHPVVSKTISELERVLDKSLFDRTARGVAPTIYGQAIIKCAVAVSTRCAEGFKKSNTLPIRRLENSGSRAQKR